MSAPVPSTQLFLESLRLSSKQRLVFDVISRFPNGARITDITEALNIHINTARGHIHELEEKGAIRRVKVTSNRPGRPVITYKPSTPDNRMIAEEYITLINTLYDQLTELSDNAETIAEAVGHAWGKKLFPRQSDTTVTDAMEFILEKFQQMGFDPTNDTKNGIIFSSCPFITVEGAVNPLICAMHRSMLQAAGEPVGLKLHLTPKTDNGTCCVVTTTETAA